VYSDRRLTTRMMDEMVKINRGSTQEILIEVEGEDISWSSDARPKFDKCRNLRPHFWTVSSEPRALAWPSYFQGKQCPYPLIMWMVEPQNSCGRLGDKSLVTVGTRKANLRRHSP
jgi:hypothetical protein